MDIEKLSSKNIKPNDVYKLALEIILYRSLIHSLVYMYDESGTLNSFIHAFGSCKLLCCNTFQSFYYSLMTFSYIYLYSFVCNIFFFFLRII